MEGLGREERAHWEGCGARSRDPESSLWRRARAHRPSTGRAPAGMYSPLWSAGRLPTCKTVARGQSTRVVLAFLQLVELELG